MNVFYLGIDPGFSGALAVLHENTAVVFDVPIVKVKTKKGFKTFFDMTGMARLLRRYANPSTNGFIVHAAIEKVGSMPEQGIVGAFRFGEGYGLWRGMLTAYNIPFTEVMPGQWKGEMMHGLGTEKGHSILRAKQLFPTVVLDRKKDDGRAEALLIAEFLRRELTRAPASTG